MEPALRAHDGGSHGGTGLAALRRRLAARLRQDGCVHTPAVEEAFATVPRHLLVPGIDPETAYRNQSIQIKFVDGRSVSSSSQPSIMAIMLEQLELQPGDRVLEIGAGSGYNAALMAHLVGSEGAVVSVDIDEDLVAGARDRLRAAGFGQVEVVRADGGFGHPPGAPYDRIIVTVGAPDLTPAWFEQLAPGGRLVLPLAIRGNIQRSIAFDRAADHLASASLADCSFMILRGAFGVPEGIVWLPDEPGAHLATETPGAVDGRAAQRLLAGPWREWPTGAQVVPGEVYGGLSLWLALREPAFVGAGALGESADGGLVPCVFGYGGPCLTGFTVGLWERGAMSLLAAHADRPAFIDGQLNGTAFDLLVRGYQDGGRLAARLVAGVRAWDRAERPSADRLWLRAYPPDVAAPLASGEMVVQKRWSRLVAAWR